MAKKLPPRHPGEGLFEEFLKPLEITRYRLAKEIGVSQRRIGQIVAGARASTRGRPAIVAASKVRARNSRIRRLGLSVP